VAWRQGWQATAHSYARHWRSCVTWQAAGCKRAAKGKLIVDMATPRTMSIRAPLVVSLSVVAGLFWSLGSDVSAIVIHFVAPVVIAVLVVSLWRMLHWRHQLLLTFGLFMLAEIVRLVSYGFQGGWHYITADSETQLWLIGSFLVQAVVGLLAFGVARLFIRRDERRVA
jgi:hypothetical protein